MNQTNRFYDVFILDDSSLSRIYLLYNISSFFFNQIRVKAANTQFYNQRQRQISIHGNTVKATHKKTSDIHSHRSALSPHAHTIIHNGTIVLKQKTYDNKKNVTTKMKFFIGFYSSVDHLSIKMLATNALHIYFIALVVGAKSTQSVLSSIGKSLFVSLVNWISFACFFSFCFCNKPFDMSPN